MSTPYSFCSTALSLAVADVHVSPSTARHRRGQLDFLPNTTTKTATMDEAAKVVPLNRTLPPLAVCMATLLLQDEPVLLVGADNKIHGLALNLLAILPEEGNSVVVLDKNTSSCSVVQSKKEEKEDAPTRTINVRCPRLGCFVFPYHRHLPTSCCVGQIFSFAATSTLARRMMPNLPPPPIPGAELACLDAMGQFSVWLNGEEDASPRQLKRKVLQGSPGVLLGEADYHSLHHSAFSANQQGVFYAEGMKQKFQPTGASPKTSSIVVPSSRMSKKATAATAKSNKKKQTTRSPPQPLDFTLDSAPNQRCRPTICFEDPLDKSGRFLVRIKGNEVKTLKLSRRKNDLLPVEGYSALTDEELNLFGVHGDGDRPWPNSFDLANYGVVQKVFLETAPSRAICALDGRVLCFSHENSHVTTRSASAKPGTFTALDRVDLDGRMPVSMAELPPSITQSRFASTWAVAYLNERRMLQLRSPDLRYAVANIELPLLLRGARVEHGFSLCLSSSETVKRAKIFE